MDVQDLKSPQLYINRELSLLEFNQRVLAQAWDPSAPLLERLRFLCIASGNLDEFFEIRVAGLKQLQELGSRQSAADALSIEEQLAAIHERASLLVEEQYRCLNERLLPGLAERDILLLGHSDWSAAAHQWLERYFEREVEPVLSPLGLDPARPFPRIRLSATLNSLQLAFPVRWLPNHPLTQADLRQEVQYLRAVGLSLRVPGLGR